MLGVLGGNVSFSFCLLRPSFCVGEVVVVTKPPPILELIFFFLNKRIKADTWRPRSSFGWGAAARQKREHCVSQQLIGILITGSLDNHAIFSRKWIGYRGWKCDTFSFWLTVLPDRHGKWLTFTFIRLNCCQNYTVALGKTC